MLKSSTQEVKGEWNYAELSWILLNFYEIRVLDCLNHALDGFDHGLDSPDHRHDNLDHGPEAMTSALTAMTMALVTLMASMVGALTMVSADLMAFTGFYRVARFC